MINRIELKPRTLPFDVVASLTQAFTREGLSRPDRNSVDAHDGEVKLSGFVRSPHERVIAETAAWSVPGIMKVENAIDVY